MQILSVTGTKGKTTVVRGIAAVLHTLQKNTLRVDTDGHWINEAQRSTLADARNLYEKAPSVCPGKYLIDAKNLYPDFTAILECSVGCNGKHGLGYSFHTVGIFTNVYEDHISTSGRLNSKEAIAEAKSFIFKSIDTNGTAIFNQDDSLVLKQIHKINPKKSIFRIGVTLHPERSTEINPKADILFTQQDGWFVSIKNNRVTQILKTDALRWTFGGSFEPSLYNALFILAGLSALGVNIYAKETVDALTDYTLDPHGGRLTVFHGINDITVLMDYAHEKQSLVQVASVAKNMTRKDGRVIGIVRLAPDRTDSLIQETGTFIANEFDTIIVYDKIDGIIRGRFTGKNTSITREVGEVSNILFEAIKKHKINGSMERIIHEKHALQKAFEIATPGSVIVYICGDDHKQSAEWVHQYINASISRKSI